MRPTLIALCFVAAAYAQDRISPSVYPSGHWPDNATIDAPADITVVLQKNDSAVCNYLVAQQIPCLHGFSVTLITVDQTLAAYDVTVQGSVLGSNVEFVKTVFRTDQVTSATWIFEAVDQLVVSRVTVRPTRSPRVLLPTRER